MKQDASEISIIPPLKWAGGKRWFASNHRHLLPAQYNKYFEPFFGSGALFFSVLPKKAYLSDINNELINLYCVIRDTPNALWKIMRAHQTKHSAEYYYYMRMARPRTPLGKAARTLYLNRTCWNGLYRVNLRGEFNVPKGTKDSVILRTDDFGAISQALSEVELHSHDFEAALSQASAGDFAFIDPPYTTAHNNNGFIKYNQTLFQWEDQLRLRDAAVSAARRGVKILITNAAHKSVEQLYRDFDVMHIDRAGVIAGANSSRGKYTEMIARWY